MLLQQHMWPPHWLVCFWQAWGSCLQLLPYWAWAAGTHQYSLWRAAGDLELGLRLGLTCHGYGGLEGEQMWDASLSDASNAVAAMVVRMEGCSLSHNAILEHV